MVEPLIFGRRADMGRNVTSRFDGAGLEDGLVTIGIECLHLNSGVKNEQQGSLGELVS